MEKEMRGQAAMEFLMTYGWAILAAIIAIGVLAYFGVFSSDEFVPSHTVIEPPFYVDAWNIIQDGGGPNVDNINIEIKNNGGDTIDLEPDGVTLSDIKVNQQTYNCNALQTTTYTGGCNVDLPPGGLCVATVACADAGIGLNAGDNFKADIAVSYKKDNSNLVQTSAGSITNTVVT